MFILGGWLTLAFSKGEFIVEHDSCKNDLEPSYNSCCRTNRFSNSGQYRCHGLDIFSLRIHSPNFSFYTTWHKLTINDFWEMILLLLFFSSFLIFKQLLKLFDIFIFARLSSQGLSIGLSCLPFPQYKSRCMEVSIIVLGCWDEHGDHPQDTCRTLYENRPKCHSTVTTHGRIEFLLLVFKNNSKRCFWYFSL